MTDRQTLCDPISAMAACPPQLPPECIIDAQPNLRTIRLLGPNGFEVRAVNVNEHLSTLPAVMVALKHKRPPSDGPMVIEMEACVLAALVTHSKQIGIWRELQAPEPEFRGIPIRIVP